MKPVFSASVQTVTQPDRDLTRTFGTRSKKLLFPFPKPTLITQRNGLAPPSPHMLRGYPILYLLLTTTSLFPPPLRISPPKVSTRKPLTVNSKKKTHICLLNLVDYPRSSPFLSSTGRRSDYPRGLPPSVHLPFGTQLRPLTPKTFPFKNYMLLFSSISLHYSSRLQTQR